MSRGAQQQTSIRSFFQPVNILLPPLSSASLSSPPPCPSSPSSSPFSPSSPSPEGAAAPSPTRRIPSSNAGDPATTASPLPLPLPSPSSPQSLSPWLPPQASIVAIGQEHIPALRRINTLLLPVQYPDVFYKNTRNPLVSGLFSRAILWQDAPGSAPKVVGGIVCRLESSAAHESPTVFDALYIQSLALLSLYRAKGLAAAALEHILRAAAAPRRVRRDADTHGDHDDHDSHVLIHVRAVFAHVWTENEEGLRWYEARGFVRDGREPLAGYYRRLRPDTAWVVRKQISAWPSPPDMNRLREKVSKSGPVIAPPTLAAPKPCAPVVTSTLAEAVNLPSFGSRPPPPQPPPPSSSTRTTATATATAAAAAAAAATSPPLPPSLPPTFSSPLTRPPTTPLPATNAGDASGTPPVSGPLSYQNARPETEWNDLPTEMLAGGPSSASRLQATPSTTAPGSGASSRSSSSAAVRRKKDRAYPAAAFGK